MLDQHIEIGSLSEVDLEEIVKAFNLAFTNYFVPVNVDQNYFLNRWKGTGVSLKHSPGIFVNGVLSGFVIMAINKMDGMTTSYNAGTGVIPSKRRRGFVTRMYEEHIFPQHKREGITHSTLEVICKNDKALKAYQKLGYVIKRKVKCFSAEVNEDMVKSNHITKSPISHEYKSPIKSRYEWSWDNNDFSINRMGDAVEYWTLKHEDKLKAYVIINNINRWVCQWGSPSEDARDVGMLIKHAINKRGKFSILNLDERDAASISLFGKLNFTPVIDQFEMVLKIKS